MFEERRNLLATMSDPASRGFTQSASERLKESQIHIERIRTMLLSGSELPTDLPNLEPKSG